MAQKVLISDMSSLVNATKLADTYRTTLLDAQYRKSMLQAGHVIAFDSKNLLETVDCARKYLIYLATSPVIEEEQLELIYEMEKFLS